MQPFESVTEKFLNWVFYLSVAFFVLTLSWNTGWNMLGDPYALGPYLSWLNVVLPLASLGVWGAFFSAWTLGALRQIHISRWFYLLLISALLMINVLFSINPESSLAVLSFFLVGFLWLSISFDRLVGNTYFWGWYGFCVGLNLILFYLYPSFIDPIVLSLMAYLGAMHAWVQWPSGRLRLALSTGCLALVLALPLSFAFDFLVLLTWFWLWALEYQNYRRKNLMSYFLALAILGLLFGWSYSKPSFDLIWNSVLPLGSSFDYLTGVGLGQLEWAQYHAQSVFTNPDQITTELWGVRRWWYELGLITVLWLPALWLLCVGAAQNFLQRTLLFWGLVLLVPEIWQLPGGILLASFWWFNRRAWEKIEILDSRHETQVKKLATKD